jgi:mono/diheme cytochrome c family protein
MSKRTFIWFGILVLVLAVVIPFAIFRSKGDASSGGSSQQQSAKELFVVNCGTCHTLAAAGTDGNYAPNLDELLAPTGPPEGKNGDPEEVKKFKETVEATEGRVLNAVENGVNSSTPGRMPGGILNESQAKEVAAWVGENAGQG